jgi:hypothetical protein
MDRSRIKPDGRRVIVKVYSRYWTAVRGLGDVLLIGSAAIGGKDDP